MVFHNSAHNRQPQPGAALLGRKIRQEQPLLDIARNSLAGVGDSQFDCVAAGHERSRDRDLFQHRVLHRLGGVIHQVRNRALDRLRIGHHRRQIVRQFRPHANAFQPAIEHDERAFNQVI